MTKEMREWVDKIGAERQELIVKKLSKRGGFRLADSERLKFCNSVIELAFPSVTLQDYKTLDDIEERRKARKEETDKLYKDLKI